MATLANTPVSDHPTSQAWITLDTVIRDLWKVLGGDKTYEPLFVMDQSLADWFPGALSDPPIRGPSPGLAPLHRRPTIDLNRVAPLQ